MKQKMIDSLNYECNGVVISFKPLSNHERTKYEFLIEGDKELTNKLKSCVKNKTVTKSSIPYCSKALFEIIEEGMFPVLISKDMLKELFLDFEVQFDEDPIFKIEDISIKNKPLFNATVKDYDQLNYFSGKGRTKDEARGRALIELLKSYDTVN